MELVFISIAAFASTLTGGFFALYLKDRLHLILGFSAGAIIGVVFFDLLPEALELALSYFDVSTILSVTVVGFVIYLMIDRVLLPHSHGGHDNTHARGATGASSIAVHSFLDGIAIGLAFQVSVGMGIVVAIAVLAHSFSDGINTVGMIIKNGGNIRRAVKWLLVDAIAPVLGITSTLLFSVPDHTLGLLLALFAGFFLYIGASDLIPESYHTHPIHWTTISTICGIVVLYTVITLAGI